MFDSTVLDVGIGLVFVYLLLSLAASSAREGLEAFLKQRAQDLFRGIKELLGDGQGNEKFVAELYDHGLINALYTGKFDPTKADQLPSYIPSKNFAMAILSFWEQVQADEKAGRLPAISLPPNVTSAMKTFEAAANNDKAKLQKMVEDWYNSAMDRVSGKYKRHTQNWLFVIGLFLSVLVNADTIQIAERLSTDKTLRGAVVQAAQNEASKDAIQQQVQAALQKEKEDREKNQTKAQPAAGQASTPANPGAGSAAGNGSGAPGAGSAYAADGAKPGAKPADDSKPADGTKTADGTAADQIKNSIGKIKTNLSDLDGVGLPLGWKVEYEVWKEKQEKAGKAPAAKSSNAEGDAKAGDESQAKGEKTSDETVMQDGVGSYFCFFLQAIPHHVAGWLLTALALSLGAPFWFDLLNKFMVVRSTVKPHEKSQEEKSKDNQPAAPAPKP